MKIHLLRRRATEAEIKEMLEELGTYIKVAVDIRKEILAGGGEYHVDCEPSDKTDGRRNYTEFLGG